MLRQLMLDSRYTGLRTNLLLNPSCETAAGANVLVRVNQATVPCGNTTVTAQGSALGWSTARWSGSVGVSAHTNVTNAPDGPTPLITSYLRKTWTTAQSTTGGAGDTGITTNNWTGWVAGAVYTVSGYIRSSIARTLSGADVQFADASGFYQRLALTQNSLTAGVWQRFSAVVTAPPVTGGSMIFILDTDGPEVIPVGTTLDVTGLLVEQAGTVGNTVRTNLCGNPSIETATTGYAGIGTATLTRDTTEKYRGTASLKMAAASGDTGMGYVTATVPTVGQTYTASAWVKGTAGETAWQWILRTGTTSGNQTVVPVTMTGAWQKVIVQRVADLNTGLSVQFRRVATTNVAWIDDVLIEQTTAPDPVYFDGATTGTSFEYGWTGAPHVTTSQQRNLPSGQLNPYFDGTVKMPLRTNLFANPHAVVTGGWSASNNGGTATASVVATGAIDGGSHFRMTINTVSATATPYVRWGTATEVRPVPGQPFTVSVWFRASAAGQYRMSVLAHDGTGAGWNVVGTSGSPTLQANVWYLISATVASWPTATTHVRCSALVEPMGADNMSRWAVNSTLDATMSLGESGVTVPGSYFDGATRPATRTNWITNPGFEVNTTGWGSYSLPIRSRDTTESHSGVASQKLVWNSNSVDGTVCGGIPVGLLKDGDVIAYSLWYKALVGTTIRVGLRANAGSGVAVTLHAGTGQWEKVTKTYTFTAAGWGTTYNTVGPSIHFQSGTTGNTFWIDDVIFEIQSPITGAYFDGAMPAGPGVQYAWQGTAHSSNSLAYVPSESVAWVGAANTSASYVYDNDFNSYVWTGTANASTSAIYASGVASITASGLHNVQSTRWAGRGVKSVRQITRQVSSDTYSVIAASTGGGGGANGIPILEVGKTYTVTATLHQDGPMIGTGNGNGSRQMVLAGLAPWVTQRSTQPANVAGDSVHTLTFTCPSTNYGQIRLYNGHSMTTGQLDLWWDNLILEETGSQKVYFDGTFPNAKWSGTANASTSVGYGFVGM